MSLWQELCSAGCLSDWGVHEDACKQAARHLADLVARKGGALSPHLAVPVKHPEQVVLGITPQLLYRAAGILVSLVGSICTGGGGRQQPGAERSLDAAAASGRCCCCCCFSALRELRCSLLRISQSQPALQGEGARTWVVPPLAEERILHYQPAAGQVDGARAISGGQPRALLVLEPLHLGWRLDDRAPPHPRRVACRGRPLLAAGWAAGFRCDCGCFRGPTTHQAAHRHAPGPAAARAPCSSSSASDGRMSRRLGGSEGRADAIVTDRGESIGECAPSTGSTGAGVQST